MTRDEAKEKIINDFCKCRVWCELYPDMCQMESCEIWWALKALSDRPNGKWLCSDDSYENAVCSNCGFDSGESYVVVKYEQKWKACPMCEARMKGGDNECL